MTEMESKLLWLEIMAKQIGRGIDIARDGKSDQWIADRTAELGNAISRTAVSEYRRGKRKSISVTDLITIAAAIGVPPVAIIFPGLADGQVSILPKSGAANAFDAVQWFSGERQTIPDSFGVVLSPNNWEPVATVSNKREYRHSPETFLESCLDRFPEDQPAREKMILDACREIVRSRQRLEEFESKQMPNGFDGGLKDSVLKAYIALMDVELNKIEELDKKIQSLNGTVIQERVDEMDEDSTDDTR